MEDQLQSPYENSWFYTIFKKGLKVYCVYLITKEGKFHGKNIFVIEIGMPLLDKNIEIGYMQVEITRTNFKNGLICGVQKNQCWEFKRLSGQHPFGISLEIKDALDKNIFDDSLTDFDYSEQLLTFASK